MAHQVNLDALIPREDFDVNETGSPSQQSATVQIRNLEANDFFYNVLRKPDFQRETSDWGAEKICGFVQSYLDGDLIPALILWQSGTQIFVIDGAHRLSALVAWVQDDYGDGPTSRKFFGGVLPDDQVAAAEHTRQLIKKKLGSYADHQAAIQDAAKAKQEVVTRAKRLGSLGIQLQWVKGDATNAEASFFKINQQATPIDKTELRLLKARTHPNALAARAIVRSGTGHKYWSRFPVETQKQIEEQAKEINELLFSPALKTPIKTLDLPVAGRGYSSQTLPLVFEFVNLTNGVIKDSAISADTAGEQTLQYLKTTKRIVNRISGTHPSSLGLHPAVYFYGMNGRYQPTAFLATVSLLRQMEDQDSFKKFTEIRKEFEAFLLEYRMLVNQVTVKYGSGVKGFAQLRDLLSWLVEQFIAKKSRAEIIAAMSVHQAFSFLQTGEKAIAAKAKDFDADAKSAVFLRDALKEPLRCQICGGLIHRNAITIDHIQRKSEGGLGDPDNGQMAHPYCNTTFKQ